MPPLVCRNGVIVYIKLIEIINLEFYFGQSIKREKS
jgi:hypothetical protein